MLALLATLALACTEPDGGTCAQKLCVGPFNMTMPWAGGGGYGMYTSCFEQFDGQPQVSGISFTKYIGVWSDFARSGFNPSTGNGGCLALEHGGHTAMLWCDGNSLAGQHDDEAEIGTVGYAMKRVSSYEHVIEPRALSCSPQSDGGCFTDAAPRGTAVRFTCPGPGICEWAPSHEYLDNVWHYSLDGMQVCVRNLSEYPLLVRDTDAVHLDGDFLGGRDSLLCLERVGDRWVETSRKSP